MKRGLLLFLFGGLVGLTAGWFLGQEQYRRKLDAAFLQIAGKVDAQLRRWMHETESKSNPHTNGLSIGESFTNRVKPVGALDTAIYIRESVTVAEIQTQRDSQAPDRVTVSGKVVNTGSRNLGAVEVVVFFLGPAGIMHEAQIAVIEGVPLAAASERTFAVAVADVPAEWTSGKARVAVTGLKFVE